MRSVLFAIPAILLACTGSIDDPDGAEVLGEASSALHEAGEVIFTIVDMADAELFIFDAATDQHIVIELDELAGWPGGTPIHTLVLEDQKTVFVTLGASPTEPAGVVALQIKSINWGTLKASVSVKKVMLTDGPGAIASFPAVSAIDPSQPIATWTQPSSTQIHGPTLLPGSKFAYFTTWTDNRIRVVDTKGRKLVSGIDPMTFDEASRQTHGVYFNPSGTWGLGTGYYYDSGELDLYQTNRSTGRLRHQGTIRLGTEDEYAAFTHHVRWFDNRYAVAGTMQFGPTSLTPQGAKVIGPSVWLVDAEQKRARKILGSAASSNSPGVWRSASDAMVVRGKLYVGEEDSIGGPFARDGFLSVYDFSDREHPVFLKRLKPGAGLPADFALGHAMCATPGGEYIYLESYASGYLLKIDTKLDAVVKVWDDADGLTTPHGGWMSGAAH